MMTESQAENLLKEAGEQNPGGWVSHSRYVAEAARKIALKCKDLDADKAYILGLLHDIGRKNGKTFLAHVYDGYQYMLEVGELDIARICLTHSFVNKQLADYLGEFDITEKKQKILQNALDEIEFDDYDLLIQLCDAIATAQGIVDMEIRKADIERRYGRYPESMWSRLLEIRQYFESKMKNDLYSVLRD